MEASHIIGGKITYRYLGNNKYEYKLTVYRDCSDQVDFDSPAIVTIYSKANNVIVSNKALSLINRTSVPAISPDPCFVPPAGICMEIGNYIDTVSLAPNGMGYTISYQRCCRNIAVSNIVLPSINGITLTTDIPPLINNSSQFINFPPLYICLTDTFNYSFASTDLDGDSLVYQFCTPFVGGDITDIAPNPATPPPYSTVLWKSPQTVNNQIPSSGSISLNSNTGKFKFKPFSTGQFEVSVCVLEYRNGSLINTNRLELQFNIVNCFLVSSIPTATNLCEGLTINFQNKSANANSFHWDFGVQSTATDTSNQFAPSFTFPGYGTYTIMLVARNTAYGQCKDTTRKVINVNPILSPSIQPFYSSCYKNNQVYFNVGGTFHNSASFNWSCPQNVVISNTPLNPISVHFLTPATKTVNVIVSQFGCSDTLQTVVSFSNPIAALDNGLLNCNEKALKFDNLSTSASSYLWDFGVPTILTDSSTKISPSYTFPNYGIYTVSLIAFDGVCSDTLKEQINVFPKVNLNPVNTIPVQCFKNNSFNFFADGTFGSAATFRWDFGTLASDSVSLLQYPSAIHFKAPGIYPIRLTLTENGCFRQRTEVVKVLPSPKADILLSDTVGCQPITIKFKSLQDSLNPSSVIWNIDGNKYTDSTVSYLFSKIGLFSFSVVYKNAYNCIDSAYKRNYIKINPSPKAKLIVEPKYTSLLNSNINFLDSTLGKHSVSYTFGDGNTSTIKNIKHGYLSAGEFQYSLIVTNEYTCSDTISGAVTIDDIGSNLIPNVFTPNGDGVNEIFFIKGESIISSDMKIYNRWGSLVFETQDALKGWNGVSRDTGRPCIDGAYFYAIKITLSNSHNYTFKGPVQLQR